MPRRFDGDKYEESVASPAPCDWNLLMWSVAVALVVGTTHPDWRTWAQPSPIEAASQFHSPLEHSLPIPRRVGDSNAAAREGIRHSLRRSLQADRMRDERYSEWMAKLSLADALQLYSEVLTQLAIKSPDAVEVSALFSEGAVEFERATFDERFRTARLSGLSVDFVRSEVRRVVLAGKVRSVAEARSELRELVVRFVTMAPRADGVAITMQFVDGACAAIDEWTMIRPPELAIDDRETITSIMLADREIGYLRVLSFRESTVSEFNQAVIMLVHQGAKSLIVDLRGNSGGLLKAGIELSQRLLPHGEILRTVGRDPAFDGRIVSSDSGFLSLPIPLVVLIDSKTMSTAEIVAMAIQSNGRGRLVGMPTHGKGRVQTAVELKAGAKAVLIVTVATLTDPTGRSLAGRPVSPDLRNPDPDQQLKAAIAEAKSSIHMRLP